MTSSKALCCLIRGSRSFFTLSRLSLGQPSLKALPNSWLFCWSCSSIWRRFLCRTDWFARKGFRRFWFRSFSEFRDSCCCREAGLLGGSEPCCCIVLEEGQGTFGFRADDCWLVLTGDRLTLVGVSIASTGSTSRSMKSLVPSTAGSSSRASSELLMLGNEAFRVGGVTNESSSESRTTSLLPDVLHFFTLPLDDRSTLARCPAPNKLRLGDR